jgi:hypothetical protein
MRDSDYSTKREGIVLKLRSRQILCIHHQVERFNPVTHRGSDTRIGGRGRPYSEASRNHSGGNGEQTDLAHLNSPYEFSLARATIRPFRIVPMSPAIDLLSFWYRLYRGAVGGTNIVTDAANCADGVGLRRIRLDLRRRLNFTVISRAC